MHTDDEYDGHDIDKKKKKTSKEPLFFDYNEVYDESKEEVIKEKIEDEEKKIDKKDNFFVKLKNKIKDYNFNTYISLIKKFLSNKFNVIVTILAILIITFGGLFIHSLIYGEEDIIISGDYVDGRYDFNNTSVVIKNGKSNKIMRLDEFLECFAHHKLDSNSSFNKLKNEEKKTVYKSFFIIGRSLILSRGYNSNTKTIYLNENDFNCCSNVICDLTSEDNPLIFDSYLSSRHEIIIPKSFDTNKPFVSYTEQINFKLTDEIINNIIVMSSNSKSYSSIINNYFNNKYKIYDISKHENAYKPNSNIKTTFYWPIGSINASDAKNNIYAGPPDNSQIITFFNNQSKGIEVEAKYGTRIIAISDGTVETVMRNETYGWFVKIKHGEYTAIYGNLNPNVVNFVKLNDKVKKGELIGYLHDDKTVLAGDGKLYFQLYKNNSLVDPLEYVSEANPRPKGVKYLTYVEGKNNKQTICLSLLATGFSNEAVAGLLANIQAESNFKTTIYGDNGTSYGICQWHKGRFTNLKKYCGNRYKTVECQLDYLLHELRNGEKNSFKVLQSKISAYQMVTKFCQVFERPAGGAKSCNRRADNYASSFYKYVKNKCK